MDCIFCKIAAGQVPAKLLAQTDHCVSFMDASPLAAGHVLVVPRLHRQKIQDLSSDENADLFLLVQKMTARVDLMTGSTLLAVHNGKDAGQEIPHLHVHLVPRSKGDSAGPIHSMFGGPAVSESQSDDAFCRLRT